LLVRSEIETVFLIILIRAIANESLPSANGTTFYVTTNRMKLAFEGCTIVTGTTLGSPVFWLRAIGDPEVILVTDPVSGFLLLRHKVFWVSGRNADTVENDSFFHF
jgi:hypothetical protein